MKRIFIITGLLLAILSSTAYAGKVLKCMIFRVEDTLVSPYAVPGRLSPSGKTFVAGISDEDGHDLLYQWTRVTLEKPWQGPTLIAGAVNEIADTVSNMQPTISKDGLMLVYTRNKGGGWEANDLWMATRSSTEEPFDNVRPLSELNTDDAEAYPYLAPSGSRLYYTSSSMIMVAEYDKNKKEFGNATEVELPEIESAISCWVSADEKTMLVTDGSAIYFAERGSVKESFGETATLTLEEVDAFVSAPSIDANGDLYVYISASNPAIYDDYDYDEGDEPYDIDYYEPEEYEDEPAPDSEEYYDGEPETIQAILHLVCSEGE